MVNVTEIKNGIDRMVMKFNLGDKVGNILTSLDASYIYDAVIKDININSINCVDDAINIITPVFTKYVSEKFGYTEVVLKTEDVLESPHFIAEMTRSVNLANQDPYLLNKVDPKEYCSRLKSIIYGWYPNTISAMELMNEAADLIYKMILELNPVS